jgi:hypothetical protein
LLAARALALMNFHNSASLPNPARIGSKVL